MTVRDRILNHLQFLYGPARGLQAAQALWLKLDQLRQGWSPPPHRPLTSGDVLLITYPDQVRTPHRAPLSALSEFLKRLQPGLVSAVHLLPFYRWTSDDGFAVVDYLAVDPRYGSWADVEALGHHYDLMFDLVCNHTSSQCPWFLAFLRDDPEYRDFYLRVDPPADLSRVVRPRTTPLLTEFPSSSGPRKVWTTFGPDQVDLNYRNPVVLLQMLEILMEYVRRGARFIRLDAVAFLWKETGTSCLHLPQTHQIVQLMRAVLDAAAPDVRLITETNVPHADNVSYFGNGTNEAHLVYNFALPPLVLHGFRTGCARELSEWAAELRTPSDHTAFLNYLASHDGIGLNPARGILSDPQIDALVAHTLAAGGFISQKALPDGTSAPYELNINYLDALSPPAAAEPTPIIVRKMSTAHAIALSLAGMPALYFHSLVGSRGDRDGALRSGIPRRINREKLDLQRLEAELNQPGSLRCLVFQSLGRWLRLRQSSAAFAPASPQQILFADPRLLIVYREDPHAGQRALCLHNLSAESVNLELPTIPGVADLDWYDATAPAHLRPQTIGNRLHLEPWQTWWGLSRSHDTVQPVDPV